MADCQTLLQVSLAAEQLHRPLSTLNATDEVTIETRSGASMAHEKTRAANVLQEFCRTWWIPG